MLYSFQGGSYNKVKHQRSGGDKALCAFLTVLRTVLDRDHPRDYTAGESRKALIGRQRGTKATDRKTTKCLKVSRVFI